MALLLRNLGRKGLLGHNKLVITKCIQPSSSQAYDEMKDFWQKNKKLNRPLSPHLSIYRPQLTSMLSLTHRATGIAMSVAIPVVATGLMFAPGDFTTYLHSVHLSAGSVIACKYIVAFPFTYHYVNGIRHLAWDWAKGFSLKETYNSGYLVVTLSFLITAALVHLI
ncbi:succinate dehydrogenase cytochrome b560 subunit, mitochondrial-like [Ylistrum balloti]|uniref:succinate dehydrogenase cytochrome b560 subunit, mitochondrial-like n=1 Tax=Ylistrum balloti TaxID=509963 RepID=UPI002905E40C|nr:succinate dehydrogenase cytochrome b560 subunit, mitochondrial-like [Ylistrum balloti]